MIRDFRALHPLISGPQPPARLHARDRRQERRTEARGQETGGKIFDGIIFGEGSDGDWFGGGRFVGIVLRSDIFVLVFFVLFLGYIILYYTLCTTILLYTIYMLYIILYTIQCTVRFYLHTAGWPDFEFLIFFTIHQKSGT